MSNIRIQDYTLRQLMAKFQEREFAIPEIQRQFVWQKPRICKLMDSIFRNYPIGISLIWVAPYSQAINIRPNNKTIIPPFNKRARTSDLIIDGQQRLSTVYGILFGVDSKPEANSYINFNDLFFNCDKSSANRFLFSKRLTDDTEGYIRLTTLLNTTPSVLARRLRLRKWAEKEARKCYNAFHSYRFYLLTFDDLGYEDVKEIFIRINSGGMTVSRADTLFTKASNVDLRAHMLDTRRGLKYGFDNISVDALQNTLGLAYGATQIGNVGFNAFLRRIEKNKNASKEFEKIWKKLQFGYEEAVDFLVNTLKVSNLDLLPSQNIYSILAYSFYLNQKRASPSQIREIKKWFWHTACSDRYSGAAFNRNIPLDIKFFRRLSNGNNARYTIVERISTIDFLRSNYRNTRTSAVNAYFIALRTKRPKYLLNGHEMLLDEASAVSNRKDKHHIFPFALLRRHNVNPRWINSIANICYLESDENQSISDSHPRIYLEDYKRKKHFGRVMRSHLIPYNSSSPVWSHNTRGAFRDFITHRGKLIVSEIEKLCVCRIFEKYDVIKRV